MTIARLSSLATVIAAAAAVATTIAAGAPALAQTKRAVQTKPSQAALAVQHKVAIQVNQNDKGVMDLALNNAKNIADYFKTKGESVAIELVAYGPGLHMLRSDASPVKERISVMSLENPNLTFAACGNTPANQAKAENKPVTLISEAKVTPSGVVRLMELQKQGYAYIRP
jgi:intracellular sulfur oxidation DsrE/DsrF family protein